MNVMMYTNIKYIYITQSYSKTRKKMCVKTTLSVNLTDTVGKGLNLKKKQFVYVSDSLLKKFKPPVLWNFPDLTFLLRQLPVFSSFHFCSNHVLLLSIR